MKRLFKVICGQAKNGQKRAKKDKKYFCQLFHWIILVIEHRICKISKKLQANWEKLAKMKIFGQK